MTETVTGETPAIAEQTPVVESPEVAADPAPAVTDADEASPGKPPVQKRIDELTRLRREAERDRDHWRAQAMRHTPATPEVAQPEAPKKPPTLAEHNYDEAAYQAALVEHVKAETARQVREDLRKEQAEQTKRQKQETFSTREREFAGKHADYLELTRDGSLPVTQTMVELLQEADAGPEVLYYLANNRDEAFRISQMDEKSAARAIGRLEAKLETPAKPAPPPKPVSKAPPPPPQIEAVEPAVNKDPSQMTDSEFAKWRKRQIAQRR
jgi:hypothetical protein